MPSGGPFGRYGGSLAVIAAHSRSYAALRRISQPQRNPRYCELSGDRFMLADVCLLCKTASQVEDCGLCYPLDSITSRGFQKE